MSIFQYKNMIFLVKTKVGPVPGRTLEQSPLARPLNIWNERDGQEILLKIPDPCVEENLTLMCI